ncbi:MAG TPA: ABC transporter substrate-binding protein [Gaiellaceae bacterium]|jgi:NitT/TauT family transport system substrate-binding protein|nr:ABC transporter substrate-binding protein [Gaiellaceae bacterium]
MKRAIPRTNTRMLVGLLGAVVALALIPIASGTIHAKKASLTTVSFMDDFTTNGTDAGYIVGEEPNGYYNKQGISLNYSPGTGSPATAQAVATGQVQFGEITTSALVTAVAAGEPIKAVAMIEGQDGFGVVTVPSITTPAGMSGKTITTGNSLLVPIFQAYLKDKGVTGVNLVTVAPSALDTSVTSGSADGCLCVAYSDRLRINATVSGGKTNFFPFSADNLGFTGNVVIVNNSTIASNPDLVKRFIKATMQAWNFAYDNPNLAAGDLQGLIANQSPLATAQTNVATLKAMKKVRFTKSQAGHPPGWMSVLDWAAAIKQMKLEGVLTVAAPSAASLFTNQFIPPLPVRKKK